MIAKVSPFIFLALTLFGSAHIDPITKSEDTKDIKKIVAIYLITSMITGAFVANWQHYARSTENALARTQIIFLAGPFGAFYLGINTCLAFGFYTYASDRGINCGGLSTATEPKILLMSALAFYASWLGISYLSFWS